MLDHQRKKASFNKRDLSEVIYGGKEGLELFLKRRAIIDNDPVLRFDPSVLHQSRLQRMEDMANKALRLSEYHDLFPLDGTCQVAKHQFLGYQYPLSLHSLMFLPTLDNLCDEEQRKEFYEPALKGKILGCYAQTELGHGSDIQRLETSATYDAKTQQFIINSPTIGSTKWWIGDLGLYCTHAAVFAQLMIAGKTYGLHCFLVPIRDPKTLSPLQGIEVGDIGPKQGFNTKDNGYARFDAVAIPRRNMLMKYHVVSKEGVYSVQGDQKISYATMLLTRSSINYLVYVQFAKIATIITKYSLLRKQFKDTKGDEIPVLDYQTQQVKALSRIGEVFAFGFTARSIDELAKFVYSEAKQGRFDRLNQAHSLTSATKAYISMEALNNAEVARRAAGGHGFHMYSGLVGVQHQISTCYTLEGEFTILMLQVARFLLKAVKKLQKGKKVPPSVEYLTELTKGDLRIEVNEESLSCPFFINSILKAYACVAVKNMALKIAEGIKTGLTEKQAWDTYAGISLTEAAIAHSILTIHSFYIQEVMKIKQDNLKTVMKKLCLLWGVQKILQRASDIYITGVITPGAFKLINKKREVLFNELRPEALTLVEAFEYSDNMLHSAIAHSNERPYENLIDWARRYNTINHPKERSEMIEALVKAKSQLKPKL